MNIATTTVSPILEARRRRAADALGLQDEILLVGAGEPVGIPGGMNAADTVPERNDHHNCARPCAIFVPHRFELTRAARPEHGSA